MAIRSYGSRRVRRFVRGDQRSLPPHIASRLKKLLFALRMASAPSDMNLPGARLHALKGDRKGFFAVDLSAGLRLVFRFQDGDAYDVDVVDYHRS